MVERSLYAESLLVALLVAFHLSVAVVLALVFPPIRGNYDDHRGGRPTPQSDVVLEAEAMRRLTPRGGGIGQAGL